MKTPTKTQEEHILKNLRYESNTGLLWWNDNAYHNVRNKQAGNLSEQGYYRVNIKGVLMMSHRIVWFLHNGCWPSGEIDHIDGDRTNNRIQNLRDVNKNVNQWNRKARQNNVTGLVGVSFIEKSGRYRAQIQARGKNKYLGTFATPQEAHGAYVNAKKELHNENGYTC